MKSAGLPAVTLLMRGIGVTGVVRFFMLESRDRDKELVESIVCCSNFVTIFRSVLSWWNCTLTSGGVRCQSASLVSCPAGSSRAISSCLSSCFRGGLGNRWFSIALRYALEQSASLASCWRVRPRVFLRFLMAAPSRGILINPYKVIVPISYSQNTKKNT